MQDKGLKM